MDLNLNNMSVVVTGGSAGIGAAIVREFLKEGCQVAFCSRSEEKVNKMLEMNGSHKMLKAKILDVKDSQGFSKWLSELKSIDIFVPNVSALSCDWDETIAVDLKATIDNISMVLPYLEKSDNPAVTYIGSKASSLPIPEFEAYGAIKAGMTHYMKTLSRKLISKRIRVNTVSPGDTFVEGGFWGNIKTHAPGVYEHTVSTNPMGRLCTPEEVAKVVAFISSPVASYVSGNNWLVDGGATNHIQI